MNKRHIGAALALLLVTAQAIAFDFDPAKEQAWGMYMEVSNTPRVITYGGQQAYEYIIDLFDVSDVYQDMTIYGFDNDQILNWEQDITITSRPVWGNETTYHYDDTLMQIYESIAAFGPSGYMDPPADGTSGTWQTTTYPWTQVPDWPGAKPPGDYMQTLQSYHPSERTDAGEEIDTYSGLFTAPEDLIYVFNHTTAGVYSIQEMNNNIVWTLRIISSQQLYEGDLKWSPNLADYESRVDVLGLYTVQPDPGDFDGDGDVDVDDINALCANMTGDGIPLPAGFEQYDLDNDGDADSADMDILIHDLVETTVGVGTEYGDFNLDGKVDTVDLTILGTYFGVGTSWSQGNANCDTTVDTVDLTILGTYFGFVASSPIPEPATLLVMGCGALALIHKRK